jgi:ABC-type nitrate/sulfonate/bicarbonate transport system permease component
VVAEVIGLLIPQTVLPLMTSVLARAAGLAGNGRFLADTAATVWAGFIGLSLNALLVWAGNKVLPWHKAPVFIALFKIGTQMEADVVRRGGLAGGL